MSTRIRLALLLAVLALVAVYADPTGRATRLMHLPPLQRMALPESSSLKQSDTTVYGNPLPAPRR